MENFDTVRDFQPKVGKSGVSVNRMIEKSSPENEIFLNLFYRIDKGAFFFSENFEKNSSKVTEKMQYKDDCTILDQRFLTSKNGQNPNFLQIFTKHKTTKKKRI